MRWYTTTYTTATLCSVSYVYLCWCCCVLPDPAVSTYPPGSHDLGHDPWCVCYRHLRSLLSLSYPGCCCVAQLTVPRHCGVVHGSSPRQQRHTVLLCEPQCIPVAAVYVPPTRCHLGDQWNMTTSESMCLCGCHLSAPCLVLVLHSTPSYSVPLRGVVL